MSSDECEVNNTLSDDCEETSDNINVSKCTSMTGLSMKVFEKRELNSYRNLPGLLATASSVDEIDVRNLDNEDVLDSGIRSEDTVISDHGKRKRVHHDYRKLSNSGYVDDAMGRRYSSSTSSASESDTPSSKLVKIKTNGQSPNDKTTLDHHSIPNTVNSGSSRDGTAGGK